MKSRRTEPKSWMHDNLYWQSDNSTAASVGGPDISNRSSPMKEATAVREFVHWKSILQQISHDIHCNHSSFISHTTDSIRTYLWSRVNDIFVLWMTNKRCEEQRFCRGASMSMCAMATHKSKKEKLQKDTLFSVVVDFFRHFANRTECTECAEFEPKCHSGDGRMRIINTRRLLSACVCVYVRAAAPCVLSICFIVCVLSAARCT